MIWEVFRQERSKDYHVHVGNVHAPDAEMAEQFAQVMHARRKPATSLWVVPKEEIHDVDADEPGVELGGVTQKEYRWATNYGTDETFAEEIEASQREQEAAERENRGEPGHSGAVRDAERPTGDGDADRRSAGGDGGDP